MPWETAVLTPDCSFRAMHRPCRCSDLGEALLGIWTVTDMKLLTDPRSLGTSNKIADCPHRVAEWFQETEIRDRSPRTCGSLLTRSTITWWWIVWSVPLSHAGQGCVVLEDRSTLLAVYRTIGEPGQDLVTSLSLTRVVIAAGHAAQATLPSMSLGWGAAVNANERN